MSKTIKMRWHKAYVVILLILGILRSASLLGAIGEYVRYKFSSVYLTHYLDDILLWWLLMIIFDLIVLVLIFMSYSKLKNFSPGAIGTHGTMLVLLALGSGIQSAINDSLMGNSWQIGFLVGVIIFLPVEIPLWVYYHKRKRLYECSAAEREHLLYGTPMPEYKPRVLENNIFQGYASQPTQLPPAPQAEPPEEQPAPAKHQVVQVHKKGEAPKRVENTQPAQPQMPQQPINFCRFCGSKLSAEAVYCTQCGRKNREEEKSC